MGVKRHPPAFSRFGTSGSRRHGDRLAGGSLRCLLTATADELVGRSMVASPDNRRFTSNPETGRHRTCAGVGPSSGPSRPRPVRRVGSSTGFAGTRLAARSWSGSFESRPGRAKLGGTLLTPTPARHPGDPPSIPSKGSFAQRYVKRHACVMERAETRRLRWFRGATADGIRKHRSDTLHSRGRLLCS